MRTSILSIGVIASVLTLNAFADPVTITTQDYVDTADALKQDKITGHSTSAVYPDSVITDTTTDGTVAKRIILDPGVLRMNENGMVMGLENGTLVDTLGNRASAIGLTEDDVKNGVIPAGIITSAFEGHLERINLKQKKKVCVQYIENAEETSENCLLWNLPD